LERQGVLNVALQREEENVSALEKILLVTKKAYDEDEAEKNRVEKILDEVAKRRRQLEAQIVKNPERLLKNEQEEQEKVRR
jgi:hypothetical protein